MNNPIVLFDNLCNFCNANVDLIIKMDTKKLINSIPVNSETGHKLLQELNLSLTDIHSLIFIDREKYYTKSTAVLRIAKILPKLWPIFFILVITPPFIRNAVYNIIASHRYQWFVNKAKKAQKEVIK